MNFITKVGLAVVVFVALLLALAAELIFIFWQRRRQRRGPPAPLDSERSSADAQNVPPGSPTSKQLHLQFLFWKENHSRVEPTASTAAPPPSTLAKAPTSPPPTTDGATGSELELARWRGLYASRILFTIREEEKEGVDSDGGRSPRPGTPTGARTSTIPQREVPEEVTVMANGHELTPFSTPCASPFYTPPPSPTHSPESSPS